MSLLQATCVAERDVLAGGALLVVNPAAAGVTDALADEVARRLSARCGALATTWTAVAGHARQLAATAADVDGMSLVVALGGDGTAREVAEGVARGLGHWPSRGRPGGRTAPRPGGRTRSGPAVLALPAGSGNSTSRNLWGDRTVHEVLDVVLGGGEHRVRHLDLIRLVERDLAVVLGASTGFLAQVLIGARAVEGRHGIDRYYTAAADVLAHMPDDPTTVYVDGELLHDGPASLVAVGGGRFRAHDFQFLPLSVLDDGELDVCVIGALTGPAVGDVAALVPAGAHLDRPEVRYRRGRRVTVSATGGHPLVAEFDGEVFDEAGPTMTVELVPAALPALCPAEPLAG